MIQALEHPNMYSINMAESILPLSTLNPSGNEVISMDVSDKYHFLYKGTFSEKEEYVVITQKMFSFWRRKWQPTPVFLPRESHGQRSLVGYSP